MIEIFITEKEIKIIGHNTKKPINQNHDLICAAVSAISQSSCAWFKKTDAIIKIDEKIPLFHIKIFKETKENLNKIYLLSLQLIAIAKQYKKNIKLNIKKGE